MDWDDAIERAKRSRAPDVAARAGSNAGRLVDGLISRLKAQDEADRKSMRRMVFFFGVAGAIYIMIFTLTWIAPPDTSPVTNRLVLALFSLILVSVGLWSARKARDLAGIDYAKPVDLFLREAERRYRFINARDLRIIVPFFVIVTGTAGLGWMTAFSRYFYWLESSTGLISFLIYWSGASVLGWFVGWRVWMKKRAPFFYEIRSMRAELDAGEQDAGA